MKKLLLNIMMISIISILSFSSCSNEEPKEFSLAGSTWVYKEDIVTITISYTTDIDCVYTFIIDDGTYTDSETSRYTYSYEEPYVEMYPENSEENAVLRGLINGNIMEVTNKSNNRNIGTFYKK